MRKALLANGIPDSSITLDFAGFRTLDSVVRCKEVFGQDNFIIISQHFHLERALYIAKKFNINAIGFAAQNPPEKYSFKTNVREYFARTKAIIDLYFLNTQPKFLGKKEIINI
jgi:SanA protein